jgi:hypothetical protein
MKLISHTVMNPAVITIYSTKVDRYRGVSLTFAHKDGGPVLKGTPQMWTYWNGFYIALKRRIIILQFKRFG